MAIEKISVEKLIELVSKGGWSVLSVPGSHYYEVIEIKEVGDIRSSLQKGLYIKYNLEGGSASGATPLEPTIEIIRVQPWEIELRYKQYEPRDLMYVFKNDTIRHAEDIVWHNEQVRKFEDKKRIEEEKASQTKKMIRATLDKHFVGKRITNAEIVASGLQLSFNDGSEVEISFRGFIDKYSEILLNGTSLRDLK